MFVCKEIDARTRVNNLMEFIAEDELVEVTPGSIRLRKAELDAGKRLSAHRKAKRE